MKNYFVSGIVIILAVMFVPLFWLKLAQWAFGEDMETKDIIIVAIGLVGAILGGKISGVITLIGVNKTIHENRRLDMEKILPGRIVATDKIISEYQKRARFLNSNIKIYKGKALQLNNEKYDLS